MSLNWFKFVILTVIIIGRAAIGAPSSTGDNDKDACAPLIRPAAQLISLSAARAARAGQTRSPERQAIWTRILEEVRQRLSQSHSGAPDWYRRFRTYTFAIGHIMYGGLLQSGQDFEVELEAVRKFFVEPYSLTMEQARSSTINMAWWEMDHLDGMDTRSLHLLSFWGNTSQFQNIMVGSEPLGVTIAKFYRDLLELRKLDQHVSARYASFFSSVNQRIALDVDPDYGKGMYLGSAPSRDVTELNQNLVGSRAALNESVDLMSQRLANLRKLELAIMATNPFFRGDGPHLHVRSLMSVDKAAEMDNAFSHLPQQVRQEIGTYPRLRLPQ